MNHLLAHLSATVAPRVVGGILIAGAFASAPAQTPTVPLTSSQLEQSPYNHVGQIRSSTSTGSGVAIGDRVVLTAAHVLFDEDFVRFNVTPNMWSWKRSRTRDQPMTARGYRAFSDYASNVARFGGGDDRAFDFDSACLYFLQPIADSFAFRRLNASGTPAPMAIVGYPSGFYSASDPRRLDMHATNPPAGIVTSFQPFAGTRRHRFSDDIYSGSGNSGGPVFANIGGRQYVVGVFVSGPVSGTEFAGIVEMDSELDAVIAAASAAVGNLGGSNGTVAETAAAGGLPLAIPDFNDAGITSPISFGGSGTATNVSVSFKITHPFIGDLEVDLIAPDGGLARLHQRAGGDANGITHVLLDVPVMAGRAVRGTWQLRVRDRARLDTGTLESWSITFSRPGTGGVAYASLVEYYRTEAANSFNYHANRGETLQALSSLYYYYAFLGLYQGELDNSPAIRDFSYYFFFAYYYLNSVTLNGDPAEATRLFYLTLGYAYYQFYLLSGYPDLANGYYAAYAAAAAG